MRYSQVRAMLAITKASLRSIFRSPSAVVFSFVFPFVFIIVFGFIGNSGGRQSYRVVMDPQSDTSNYLYKSLVATDGFNVVKYPTAEAQQKDMQKGRIAGVIRIDKTGDSAMPYRLKLKTANSASDKWPQLKTLLDSKINEVSDHYYKNREHYAAFDFDYTKDVEEVRPYKTIDFILPGQLGFSLLSAGVFGVAFMFFNLRTTMVLKRFFATPISRSYIVLGEALSRVIFQMLTAIIIIVVGYYFFGFTLIHGFSTFLQMLVLSFIGLMVFMGFGFIVSGLATSDSSIPPFANLITLPQFLLGGTFFSINAFPGWLQPISRALPLTYLNDALRSVAFEGANLWDVKLQIGILIAWGIAAYIVAIKVFKWE